MWVFTAQLVEHCSANADAMGSSPVEALKIIFRLKFAKALFTVNLLIYITIKSSMLCKAILGHFVVLARNCFVSALDYIVIQMRNINREKGYC